MSGDSDDATVIIKGGRVVTETGVVDADILVVDGSIRSIGSGLSGGPVVDARGAWVLPGVVDPHLHTSVGGFHTMDPLAEDLKQATAAALMGGVTTVSAYVNRGPGMGLIDAVRYQIQFGKEHSAVDFAINALCLPGDPLTEAVEEGVRLGVTTYKAFLGYYVRGVMMEDNELVELMTAVASHDGLVLIHPENGRATKYYHDIEYARDPTDIEGFMRCSPGILEAEGMFRAAALAELTGCDVLFVHLSAGETVRVLSWLKEGGGPVRVWSETQPHYLILTEDALIEHGPLAKIGPPLRRREDVAAVWGAVEAGHLDLLSSDHSPRTKAMKHAAPNIFDAPYGGITPSEALLPLAYALGVETGRFDMGRLAELTATSAAKAYGLYPRKGAIRVGADADFAIVPIEGEPREIGPRNLHGRSDYSIYTGLTSRGFPKYVVRRGCLAVSEGEVLDNPSGRYLARGMKP